MEGEEKLNMEEVRFLLAGPTGTAGSHDGKIATSSLPWSSVGFSSKPVNSNIQIASVFVETVILLNAAASGQHHFHQVCQGQSA
eukprot:4078209-Amphidinium_carterae.1